MCIKYIYICIYSHVEYHKLRTTVSTRLLAESSLEACSTPHHGKGWTAQHHPTSVTPHRLFQRHNRKQKQPRNKSVFTKGCRHLHCGMFSGGYTPSSKAHALKNLQMHRNLRYKYSTASNANSAQPNGLSYSFV